MSSIARIPYLDTPVFPLSDTSSGQDTDTLQFRCAEKRKFKRTRARQECLLQWLELPGNFDLLTKPVRSKVSRQSTALGSKRVKKIDGYRSMALHMNQVADTEWSENTARSRFGSFMAAFRKAKRQSPNDLPSAYRRVDALLGSRRDSQSRDRRKTTLAPTLNVCSLNDQKCDVVQDNLMVTFERNVPTAGASSGESTPSSSTDRCQPRSTVMSVSSHSHETARQTADTHALLLESQRLALKKKEVELKQLELQAQQIENQQKLEMKQLELRARQHDEKQQELEVKKMELRASHEIKQQKLEVLTRLVESGKSPAEVRGYFALMDSGDKSMPRSQYT